MTNQSDNTLNDAVQLLLQRPGLEAWARVCMSLLALTNGIERFMDGEDEYPHRDLRQRVQHALSANDEAALFDIAGLHVFEYRVMAEETLELWQPLSESLEQFQQRYADKVRVWKDISPFPDRVTIEDWLRRRVPATRK